jgi:hypothetical protein
MLATASAPEERLAGTRAQTIAMALYASVGMLKL